MFFIVWFIVLLAIISFISSKYAGKKTVSDDGHTIERKNDITCNTKYNHNHPEERRYIVHEEPTQGYVILNGKKRKIEDCKYL